MPIFILVSREHDFEREQFVARDSSDLLARVHRLGWNAADVERDGEYQFSVSLNSSGVWSITQREEAEVPRVAHAAIHQFRDRMTE